jgi:ribose 1,5-bisphosphokinase
MTIADTKGGMLFYLVGASGAGKDSLLRYARTRLAGKPVTFAHRYITRPVELSGENHIALSPEEFSNRLVHGCFAMHWESHGLSYGVGVEINAWMSVGLNVVVNGSRAYLPQAMALFPALVPVWVQVKPDVLAQRLHQRGRETAAEIEQRLQRAQAFSLPDLTRLQTLDNDGALDDAGERLCQLLMA